MEKKYIQSIVRACDILDYISKNEKVRLNELTKEFKLAKTTIFGILSTLEYKDMVYKDENSNYYLGIKNYTYGKIYERNFDLKEIIHPFLEKLAKKYNETVHMAMEENEQVLYVDRVKSSHAVRLASNIGGYDSLYCSAIGKLILAYKSQCQIDDYINKTDFKKRAPNTITEALKLKAELENIKSKGLSIDNEELEQGLICVAAPIFTNSKFTAAISISGPTNRIDKEMFSNMTEDINKIGKNISELL
ncbi:IclR family transcriptional regulator [Clostridium oceanicum]|uniref:IclR family transcriptional regulator n=1 Tax=Clostridium oceanicum TaxID=1543 RepID=A0ABN1JLC3_9CLOT